MSDATHFQAEVVDAQRTAYAMGLAAHRNDMDTLEELWSTAANHRALIWALGWVQGRLLNLMAIEAGYENADVEGILGKVLAGFGTSDT